MLGKEFDLAFAARLACQTPPRSSSALNEARSRHMVWVRANGFQCVFVHDKIREALLARLPDSRSERNCTVAPRCYLQHHAPQRVSELAYHFDAAGDSQQALGYALEAAKQARARHALEIAEQQYRIAQRGAATAPTPMQFQIAEGLGDVLMLRGRYDAAEALFEQAAMLAEGHVAHAQICGKLGELSQKRGAIQRAIEYIEEALRSLGQIVPRSDLMSFPHAVLGAVGAAAPHAPATACSSTAAQRQPSEAEQLTVRLFNGLALAYWYGRSTYISLWAHLRNMNLAERYPPTLELAHAYSSHAAGHGSHLGFQPRSDLRFQTRDDLCPQVAGDPQVVWRSVGTRPVAPLFRHPALHGIAVRPVHRSVSRSAAAAGAHRATTGKSTRPATRSPRRSIASAICRGRLRKRNATTGRGWNWATNKRRASSSTSGPVPRTGPCPKEIIARELARDRKDTQSIAQVLLAEGVRRLGQRRGGRSHRADRAGGPD